MNKSIAVENEVPQYRGRWGWFLAPLLVAVFGIAIFWLGVTPAKAQAWIHQLGLDPSSFKARLFFFLIAVVFVSLVLPKTVLSITSGALFGTWVGGVMVALVSVSAAAINYALARWWLGNRVIERLEKDAEANPLIAAISDLARNAGYGFHTLVRLAPIPSMVINYSMGAFCARMKPFFTAVIIGVFPQLLWVHGGTIASSQSISPFRWVSATVSILAAIMIAVIIPRKVAARIKDLQNTSLTMEQADLDIESKDRPIQESTN